MTDISQLNYLAIFVAAVSTFLLGSLWYAPFLFGKAWLEDGKLVCKPSTKTGSHMITSSLEANCLLESPLGDGLLVEGQSITASLLPWLSLGQER